MLPCLLLWTIPMLTRDEYGRCTEGMALSYLGEAYLWKAYKARVNESNEAKSKENIQLAKQAHFD